MDRQKSDYLAITLFVIFLSLSCTRHEKVTREIPVTRVEFSNVKDDGKGLFNDYFNIVKVIELESDSIALLSEVSRVSILDSLIFIFDKKYSALKVFDIEGKYRYSIGKIGQAEGEFTSLNDFSLDREQKIVSLYSNSSRAILRYSTEGKYLSKTEIPFFAFYMAPIGAAEHVFYVNFNFSEKTDKNNVIIADNQGKIKEFWAPYKNQQTPAFSFTGYITENTDGVLINKAFNDTIYQLYPDRTILPRYHLDFDVSESKDWEKLPISKLNFNTTRNWTILESGFLETPSILAFTLFERTRPIKYFFLRNSKQIFSDDYFDKRSFVRFMNQARSSIGDTLISSINSDFFLAVRDKNLGLVDFIKNEDARLSDKLSKLKETDNPILILYKLRGL